MKRKLLFAIGAILASIGIQAQSWTSGAEISAGDYYLYNISAGKYLNRGNDWNTRASVDNAGCVVTVSAGDAANAFYLKTNLGFIGDDGYIDKATDNEYYCSWVIEPVTVQGYTNVYTIKSNGTKNKDKKLFWEGKKADNGFYYSAVLLEGGFGAGENRDCWLFIPKATREDSSAASPSNPVDVTYLVTNPSFERPDQGGWTGAWAHNAQFNEPRFNGRFMENWQASGALGNANVYQDITVERGHKYQLTALTKTNSDNEKGVTLYFGDQSTSISGTTVNTSSVTSPSLTTTLRIGYKRESCVSNWVVWDEIHVYDLGEDLETFIAIYDALKPEGDKLTSSPMAASTLAALNNAMNASIADISAAKAAITALETAIAEAQKSIDVYKEIKSTIEYAKTIAPESVEFADIDSKYNDGTYAAVSEVIADYQTLVIATLGTEKGDFTAAIFNNGFEMGKLTGWAIAPSDDTAVRSTEDNNYKMTNSEGKYLFNTWWKGNPCTQTIAGLPAGSYTLSAIVASDNTNTIYLIANGGHNAGINSKDKGTGTQASYTFTYDGTAALTIGVVGGESDGTYREDGYVWYKADNFQLQYLGQVDYSVLAANIETATKLNGTITNGVTALQTAIEEAQKYMTSALQEEIDKAAADLATVIEQAKATIAARLKLAGIAKKANALKAFITDDITEEVTEATAYVNNADATAADATAKIDALNARFATWEEVELQNAGFDTDINIAADGTNTGTPSAIDKNTGEKQTLYDQTGWTSISKHTSTAAHSASAVYGAKSEKTPGTCTTNAPAADMYGATEGGALQMSSGWADYVRYKQTIAELPAGKYVFYYEAYNANTSTGINGNYFGIGNLDSGDLAGTNYTFKYSETKSFASNTWVIDAFAFTTAKDLTDKAEVMIGIEGADSKAGSGGTAKLWIDNVKIYRIGNYELTLDETSATAPAAYKKVDVTVKRQLKEDNWNTFCVPFDMEIPEGWDVQQLNSSTKDGEHVRLVFSTAESIKAGVPYLVKPAAGVEETFGAKDVAITTEFTNAETEHVDFIGNYAKGYVPEGSYFINNSTFYVADTADGVTLKGFRAYITPKATDINEVKIFFGDEAVNIDGIHTEMENGAWYTIQGVQVERPTQSGIYIHNGKKVWMK